MKVINEIVVLSDGETYSGADDCACVIQYDEALAGDWNDANEIPESAIIRRISIQELLDCWEKHNG